MNTIDTLMVLGAGAILAGGFVAGAGAVWLWSLLASRSADHRWEQDRQEREDRYGN